MRLIENEMIWFETWTTVYHEMLPELESSTVRASVKMVLRGP
jgi:hypothetical protein